MWIELFFVAFPPLPEGPVLIDKMWLNFWRGIGNHEFVDVDWIDNSDALGRHGIKIDLCPGQLGQLREAMRCTKGLLVRRRHAHDHTPLAQFYQSAKGFCSSWRGVKDDANAFKDAALWIFFNYFSPAEWSLSKLLLHPVCQSSHKLVEWVAPFKLGFSLRWK